MFLSLVCLSPFLAHDAMPNVTSGGKAHFGRSECFFEVDLCFVFVFFPLVPGQVGAVG